MCDTYITNAPIKCDTHFPLTFFSEKTNEKYCQIAIADEHMIQNKSIVYLSPLTIDWSSFPMRVSLHGAIARFLVCHPTIFCCCLHCSRARLNHWVLYGPASDGEAFIFSPWFPRFVRIWFPAHKKKNIVHQIATHLLSNSMVQCTKQCEAI